MKRTATVLSLIAAAMLAAPAAMAGSEIVKCVDGSGHVTLTDRPCDGGTTTIHLEQESRQRADHAAMGTPAPQRYVLPVVDLRHDAWQRPAVKRPAPLSRDVATLKAARQAMLMLDARPTLAGLN